MQLWKLALVFSTLSLMPGTAEPPVTANPGTVGLAADRLERIGAMMQRYIDRKEIAGGVTLVARHGQVAWLKAQGVMDLGSGKPMTEDTIFRIASMTKPIASVALMMLYEEGYFQLNDPLWKFIPEYKNPMVAVPDAPNPYKLAPADRPITIRHLLTHTAGLANTYVGLTVGEYNKLAAARKPDDTVGDFVRRLAKLPLNFQPGTSWEYGPGTDVVGRLVEVISGKPLDQYLAERIFAPLRMEDTAFYQPDAKLARMATIYTPGENGGLTAVPAPAAGPKKYFSGSGGLSSTIGDYYRFCQMVLNGGQANGTRLLSRKTVQLMTTNHIGDLKLWSTLPGEGFGLGFSVKKSLGESANPTSVGSYGWGGAFGTIFFIDPKEEMIGVMMIQLRPYSHVNIRQDFKTVAMQAVMD